MAAPSRGRGFDDQLASASSDDPYRRHAKSAGIVGDWPKLCYEDVRYRPAARRCAMTPQRLSLQERRC